MATGATPHLEGTKCGSPVPGLPLLSQSHWFTDRRQARGPQAMRHLSLSLCVTGERSHHGQSPSSPSQYLTPPPSKYSGTDRSLAHQ